MYFSSTQTNISCSGCETFLNPVKLKTGRNIIYLYDIWMSLTILRTRDIFFKTKRERETKYFFHFNLKYTEDRSQFPFLFKMLPLTWVIWKCNIYFTSETVDTKISIKCLFSVRYCGDLANSLYCYKTFLYFSHWSF